MSEWQNSESAPSNKWLILRIPDYVSSEGVLIWRDRVGKVNYFKSWFVGYPYFTKNEFAFWKELPK